ncbi:MAG: DoxX family membrane protein [Candidatus Kerfeldbacteria bacterium]|nr:DoxX family membrane protein [Candidatus Kerfeldbacteria bacterium]
MKRLLNKDHLTHPFVFLFCRVVVGGVFLFFGVAKAIEPQQSFYASIRAYEMLPDVIVPTFATVILVAEIVFGLGVLLGFYARVSNWALVILLAMFIIAIAQAMIRGLYLPDCGCSGSFIQMGETPREVLSRDLLLLGCALWLSIKDKARRYSLDSVLS